MVAKFFAIFAIISLAACTAPSGTFCDIAEPHRFDDTELAGLKDATVTRELAHNERGRRLCGWKPQG